MATDEKHIHITGAKSRKKRVHDQVVIGVSFAFEENNWLFGTFLKSL